MYPPKSFSSRARKVSNIIKEELPWGSSSRARSCFTGHSGLKDEFDCKLDLTLRDRRPGEQPGNSAPRAVRGKDVGIVRRGRGSEVGMVQDVKDLGAELHVEVLRDAPDVVILED